MESNERLTEKAELLQFSQLSVDYGDSPALRDVSLSVGAGKILGVVGESGSGKSTCIYAALGLLGRGGHVTEGEIRYDGRSLLALSEEELRRLRGRELALISQNPMTAFHPVRTIKSQLRELIRSHSGLSYSEAEERLLAQLARMRLPEGRSLLNRYAFELSGGMCQRMSIAMATALDSRLLFADEPTSALDVTVQAQVVQELAELREHFGTAIFMVSHNMGVIAHISDEIVVMYAGMVLEKGKTKEVIRRPLHPYTRNLLRAVPRLGQPAPRGVRSCVPDRSRRGCPYWEGCSRSRERCRSEKPDLMPVTTEHQLRCHFPETGEEKPCHFWM